ncbi:MAG: hypothetical protein E6192_05495, partial [Finegoldia magna]|nr:hypothetical protein [Finegoldia magna]
MNETKIIKLFKEGMIFMRKFKILALLLMASLMFAGCSKEDNKQTSSTEQKTEEKTEEKKEE